MSVDVDAIDIAKLCGPLAGDAPAGRDVREDFATDSLYYRLRDARAEARALERQADAAGAAEPVASAQWAAVQRLAVELLSTQAKDLEVAAWCTEALLRRCGLDGLAAGARLMAGLVDGYWDDLHPLPDDEGMARRTAPVAGLNGEGADGTLIQPLRKLPLFSRADGSPLAFWQYQQAAEVAGIGDAVRRQQRLDAGVPAFHDVETEARAAAASLAVLQRSAIAAAAGWAELERALEAHAGADAPPMSRVRAVLADIVEIAARHVPAEHVQRSPESAADATAIPAARAPAGGISGRDDALRLLEQIAAFFQSTEPHSPLAYTLREAVRRARLSWPELLEEIVPDFEGRAAILTSLGIRPGAPPE